MAVTAHDVALRGLCQDLVFSSPADHLGDDVVFRRRISMVELHDVVRKALTAIGTRSFAQFAQDLTMEHPASAHFLDTRRVARLTPSKGRELRVEVAIRSRRMTIRTNDVAFRDLGQQEFARLQKYLASHDRKRLVGWVAVVEVHHPRRERLTAIGARTPAKITKERHRGLFASSNSLELFVAMGPVVGGVVEALILSGPHDQELEQMFTSCQ